MKENAHGVHAESLCPAKLYVDPLRIKSVSLPHFQFVNGIRRIVVAPYQPRLMRIPGIRLFRCPARVRRLWRRLLRKSRSRQQRKDARQASDEFLHMVIFLLDRFWLCSRAGTCTAAAPLLL